MAKKKRPKPKRTREIPPLVNCVLLCHDARQSVRSGVFTLEDVIHVIGVGEAPAELPGLVAFIRLYNVHGEQEVVGTWSYDGDEEPAEVLRLKTHPQAHPLGLVTACKPLPPLRVERPGRHILVVTHNGIPVGTLPIDVHVAGMEFPESP